MPKKVAIVGSMDYLGTTLFSPDKDDSTSKTIIVNENEVIVFDYELKNYKVVDPIFIPNKRIRNKYKRNLRYRS